MKGSKGQSLMKAENQWPNLVLQPHLQYAELGLPVSPCLCGFSTGSLVSSHSPKT